MQNSVARRAAALDIPINLISTPAKKNKPTIQATPPPREKVNTKQTTPTTSAM
jgi:hypothetical protein